MISLEDAYADYAAALERSAASLIDDERRQALFSAVVDRAALLPAPDLKVEAEFVIELAKHQVEPGVYERMGAIYTDDD